MSNITPISRPDAPDTEPVPEADPAGDVGRWYKRVDLSAPAAADDPADDSAVDFIVPLRGTADGAYRR